MAKMSKEEKEAKKRAGLKDCICPWGIRSLGKLYGISMGRGWVRLDTTPGCPHHNEIKRYGKKSS